MVKIFASKYTGRFQNKDKPIFIWGFLAIMVLLICILVYKKSEPELQIYHLPGDIIPEFEYPETNPYKGNAKSVEDLVSTCYSFRIDANGQMVDISCPMIHDKVAEDFNAMVVNYVNSLVGDTEFAVEHEYSAAIHSFHYEAFYEPDDLILTVILYWEADEENRSEVWILDLSEGRFLNVSECPPRFF